MIYGSILSDWSAVIRHTPYIWHNLHITILFCDQKGQMKNMAIPTVETCSENIFYHFSQFYCLAKIRKTVMEICI